MLLFCDTVCIIIQLTLVTDLNVHFNDGFADQRRTEERAERNEEMPTCDSSEIKQRVRNLQQNRCPIITSASRGIYTCHTTCLKAV